ncbi:MAG: cyclic lactone autoinducer peptide [Clostridiaceae bacterium]|nr:cyclic lactone autoinducer peptide [Clostridiaceae bacterium]
MFFMIKALSRKNLLPFILGAIAMFSIFIAQTSANACIAWAFEQPKLPKSLIKVD